MLRGDTNAWEWHTDLRSCSQDRQEPSGEERVSPLRWFLYLNDSSGPSHAAAKPSLRSVKGDYIRGNCSARRTARGAVFRFPRSSCRLQELNGAMLHLAEGASAGSSCLHVLVCSRAVLQLQHLTTSVRVSRALLGTHSNAPINRDHHSLRPHTNFTYGGGRIRAA